MSERFTFATIGMILFLFGALAPSLSANEIPMFLSEETRDTIEEKSGEKGPDQRIVEAVQEVDSLYARFVAILNNVDIPERYEAVEEILQELWMEVATLESRYPDVDQDMLNEAIFADKEFGQLADEFDRQMERLRAEMPG